MKLCDEEANGGVNRESNEANEVESHVESIVEALFDVCYALDRSVI